MRRFFILFVGIFCGSLFAASNVTIHGYAEVHANYNESKDVPEKFVFDPHRVVIGVEALLADPLLFSMEVDFEHGFSAPELEFAQLDYRVSNAVTLRFGHMLMPVGRINEFHEPPQYFSVERPNFHNKIIPTTWGETGLGVVIQGMEGLLRSRIYLVNGMDMLDENGGLKSFRSGRQKGVYPKAADLAGVARLEYTPVLGLDLGLSGYLGGVDQSDDEDMQILFSMVEFDVQYSFMGFVSEGAFAVQQRSGSYFETMSIDEFQTIAGLVEAGYKIPLSEKAVRNIVPFVRYEYMENYGAAEGNILQVVTGGVAYFPIPSVAFKLNGAYNMEEMEGGSSKEYVTIDAGFGLQY